MNIKVNDRFEYNIETNAETCHVNGSAITIDAEELTKEYTHVLYKNRSYNVELVAENKAEKTSVYKINGNLYNISIEDQYDLLLKQLGMDNMQANKVKDIKAPMPGLVLNIFVEEGMEVSKGENILVLEAMKMENIIKSPAEGRVKTIFIKNGDKVEKNQILLEFV